MFYALHCNYFKFLYYKVGKQVKKKSAGLEFPK